MSKYVSCVPFLRKITDICFNTGRFIRLFLSQKTADVKLYILFVIILHLEKKMATTPVLLLPWTEECGRFTVHGVSKSQIWLSNYHSLNSTSLLLAPSSFLYIGEGNGNPLQYSWLENPRDRGAYSAAVYGVTQSWTRLKRLSSSSSFLYETPFQELFHLFHIYYF